MTIDLLILEDGTLVVPWDDRLPLAALGTITAAPRVSDVEFDPQAGGWTVCHLDGTPMVPSAFAHRQDALSAEHAYVVAHLETLAQAVRSPC